MALRYAKCMTVLGFAGAMALAASGPVAAQDEEEVTEFEVFEVTGSRISRADVEGALPVTVIDRAEIDGVGEISVGDLLRDSTFNSFGSYRSASGSSFQGQSLIGLRGLGSQRTLILLNGRRLPPSPVTQGTGVDLNTIPLAAVERIELLQDGASAVYGSDAIGGVVNIILRKDYSGTQLRVGAARPTREGADEESAYLTSGFATDKGSLMIGISHFSRDIIFDRDRPYTSADFGDGTNFSTTEGLSPSGNSVLRFDTLEFEPGPNCPNDGLNLAVYNDDVFGLGGQLCTFTFANVSANITSLQLDSIFLNGDRILGDGEHSIFYNAIFSRNESFGRFAPVPDTADLDLTSPNNPTVGTSAPTEVRLFHRYQALGNRDNTNYNYLFTGTFGVQGSLPFGNFSTYEIGARYSRFNFDEFGSNYLLRSVARQFQQDGTYDPYNPFNNSEDVLNQMRITSTREAEFKTPELFGGVGFEVAQLPAGALSIAVGGEYRDEDFFDQYDSQSEAGAVGGSAGNSAAGSRSSYAGYLEALVPIVESLELSAAVRYDSYSIGGSATSPKISLRYQPIDNLVARASFGQGFRVPTFSDLFAQPSFSAETARDFTTCDANMVSRSNCPNAQYDTTILSNSDLDPEESDQFTFGVVYQPTDWVDFSFDYYNIQLDDALTGFSVQELINREAAGRPLPEGSSIDRMTSDGLPDFTTQVGNVTEINTDGVDLSIGLNVPFSGFGNLKSTFRYSYVLGYEDSSIQSGVDQVGAAGVPEFRAEINNRLEIGGNKRFVWRVQHIDSTIAQTEIFATQNPPPGHVASATYHDFQFGFEAPFGGDVAVGVRNAFDRDPSINTNVAGQFDDTLYDPYGRVPYITFTQDFD